MIKFNNYKVTKHLSIAYLEVDEDGYYHVYGGFEVYSHIKGRNGIDYLKKKERYLDKTRKLTNEDLIKTNPGHGLTFLWFTKESDMRRFMRQFSDNFYDAGKIKLMLKQKKIFGHYKSRQNIVLEYS